MNVGVAGLGGMGEVHARNAATLEGARLVAVAAARPGRAEEVARSLGGEVRACTYAELFEAADVEAVVLATRTCDHAEHAVEVLRRGKHLLLEKPGAATLAHHDRIEAEAREHPGLVLQVAYMRRRDPLFAGARELVAGGAIGTPLLVHLASREHAPPGEDQRASGGFILDVGVHDFDTARWMLGQEPVEAYAVPQAHVYPGLDMDNAVVLVRFDGGGIATTHLSRTSVVGHDMRCEVVGTDGSVVVRHGPAGAGLVVVGPSARPHYPPGYRVRFAEAYREQLRTFVAACTGRGEQGPGLGEDRAAVACGVAARASAARGAPLEVGPDWPWEPPGAPS